MGNSNKGFRSEPLYKTLQARLYHSIYETSFPRDDFVSAMSLMRASYPEFDISSELMEDVEKTGGKKKGKQTALVAACEEGRLDIVRFLLKEEKVDVNARDNDRSTGLMLAASKGNVEIVKLLLRIVGVDKNAVDEFLESAAYKAVIGKRVEVFRVLMGDNDCREGGEAELQARATREASCVEYLLLDDLDGELILLPVTSLFTAKDFDNGAGNIVDACCLSACPEIWDWLAKEGNGVFEGPQDADYSFEAGMRLMDEDKLTEDRKYCFDKFKNLYGVNKGKLKSS